MSSSLTRFIANADYEENDRSALNLQAGQEVICGPSDQTWPGWIWVTDEEGRAGYVPKEILQLLHPPRSLVLENFDSKVLKLQRGCEITSLKQIHGWHWCQNAIGEEGWVAGYLLRPIT